MNNPTQAWDLAYIDLSGCARAWKVLYLSACLGLSGDPFAGLTSPVVRRTRAARVEDLPIQSPEHRLAWLAELHCITSPEGEGALYHPPTQTLFAASQRVTLLLKESIESKADVPSLAARYGLSADESQAILEQMASVIETRPPVTQAQPTPGMLRKLVMNVSHDCNMRCLYCIAQGGSYGKDRSLMSPQIARQSIRRLAEHYAEVGEVVFFGGEPSLNPSAIQAACEQLQKEYAKGNLASLPLCGMVTNGLELSPEMLSLIQRYRLSVTVSLDGPASLTDRLRKARDGGRTMQRVTDTIRALQRLTAGREPAAVEVVYTRAHSRAGISIADLLNYFRQEFGIHNVYLSPVIVPPEHDLQWAPQEQEAGMLRAAVGRVIASWSTVDPLQAVTLTRCLHPIVTGQHLPYLCTAGLDHLAVLPDGSLYPCYLLLNDEFYMGSINDAHLFQGERFQAVQEYLRSSAKSNLGQCRDCWLRGLCHTCWGRVHRGDKAPLHQTMQIPPDLCAFNRQAVESVFLSLCHVHNDPAAWDALIENWIAMMRANVERK